MLEHYLSAILHVDFIWMLPILVLVDEVANKLGDFFLRTFFECVSLLLFDCVVVEQLIVEIEVAFGYDLEERFSIEVDVFILLVGLVVDVGICETE